MARALVCSGRVSEPDCSYRKPGCRHGHKRVQSTKELPPIEAKAELNIKNAKCHINMQTSALI